MKYIRIILIILLAAFAFHINTVRQKLDETKAAEAQMITENAAVRETLEKTETEASEKESELVVLRDQVRPYVEEYEKWKKRTDSLQEILQH